MTSSTARVHACVKYICKSKFTFKSWNIVVDKSIMMIIPQKDTSNLMFRKIWFAIQIHSNWALISAESYSPERLFRCWTSQQLASFPGRVVKVTGGHLRLSTAEGDVTSANAGLSAVLSSCSWATRHHSRWVVETARSRTQVVKEKTVSSRSWRSFRGSRRERPFSHLMRRSRETQFRAPGASWNGDSWQTSARHVHDRAQLPLPGASWKMIRKDDFPLSRDLTLTIIRHVCHVKFSCAPLANLVASTCFWYLDDSLAAPEPQSECRKTFVQIAYDRSLCDRELTATWMMKFMIICMSKQTKGGRLFHGCFCHFVPKKSSTARVAEHST